MKLDVHITTQYPSSMTEGSIETSEILITIPRFGQELSIYIRLNPAKTAVFMHPK